MNSWNINTLEYRTLNPTKIVQNPSRIAQNPSSKNSKMKWQKWPSSILMFLPSFAPAECFHASACSLLWEKSCFCEGVLPSRPSHLQKHFRFCENRKCEVVSASARMAASAITFELLRASCHFCGLLSFPSLVTYARRISLLRLSHLRPKFRRCDSNSCCHFPAASFKSKLLC